MKHLLTYLLLLSVTIPGYTQDGYKIGDKINSFSLVNAIDNNKVSLADYSQLRGVVLIFTNNSCPYSKLYEERILQLASEYESKNIKFIFINSDNGPDQPENAPRNIALRAKEKNYNAPFLIDSRNGVGNLFGASKNPETFVLKNVNGNFVLHYKGAIDDNPQVASDVSNQYLREALVSLINNTTLKVTEKRASGCMINGR